MLNTKKGMSGNDEWLAGRCEKTETATTVQRRPSLYERDHRDGSRQLWPSIVPPRLRRAERLLGCSRHLLPLPPPAHVSPTAAVRSRVHLYTHAFHMHVHLPFPALHHHHLLLSYLDHLNKTVTGFIADLLCLSVCVNVL